MVQFAELAYREIRRLAEQRCLAVVEHVLASLADQGFRRIVVWRGCGGHDLQFAVEYLDAFLDAGLHLIRLVDVDQQAVAPAHTAGCASRQ